MPLDSLSKQQEKLVLSYFNDGARATRAEGTLKGVHFTYYSLAHTLVPPLPPPPPPPPHCAIVGKKKKKKKMVVAGAGGDSAFSPSAVGKETREKLLTCNGIATRPPCCRSKSGPPLDGCCCHRRGGSIFVKFSRR